MTTLQKVVNEGVSVERNGGGCMVLQVRICNLSKRAGGASCM